MQVGFRTVLRAGFTPSAARWRVGPAASSPKYRPAQFRTLTTKRYTVEHEAVSYDDASGVGIISITDHAQSQLGDVVFVELPAVGTEVKQGDQIGAVESVKSASDIYAPISGTIEGINETLNDEPGLLNKSAEDRGWLCRIKASEPTEIEKLLTFEEYKKSWEEEH